MIIAHHEKKQQHPHMDDYRWSIIIHFWNLTIPEYLISGWRVKFTQVSLQSIPIEFLYVCSHTIVVAK